MNANQLCQRLGRSDRGNRYWTGRRVKIGVRPRDRPCSGERTELPFVDCEIERRKQLGRKHGGVKPRIQMRLGLAQCFALLAYVKSELLEVSIVGFGQLECFVEREYRCTVRLPHCKLELAECRNQYAGHR